MLDQVPSQGTEVQPAANTTEDRDGWRVLLIGGSSGTGKTTIAQVIARRLSTSLLLVDDIRLALQEATTLAEHPELHAFLGYRRDQWCNSESIRDDWIRLGQALISPLKAIMAHHIAVPGAGPIILEGDGVLPALAAPQSLGDLKHLSGPRADRALRAVFIIEPDEGQIIHNLRARGRGFEARGHEEQKAIGHASWLFGQWLAASAEAYNLPVLPARPYESCRERVMAAIAR